MAKILIIDDDKAMCTTFSRLIKKIGHEATSAYTMKEGFERITESAFDVVLLDVVLPDGNGLKVLPKIKETVSEPEVIIITGLGDPDGAELAIENGAWDYITKPASINTLTLTLKRVLQYRDGKKKQQPLIILQRDAIIGKSAQIKQSMETLAMAATSAANVLISGETGTGKEIFARAIHDNSVRAHMNFVVVDCAALPESLVESILFGHDRGAFTGADRASEGLVKQADGGTLFLDEIGELPLTIQKAFLRVLQEKRYRPVGSQKEDKSDFRLIAATNRDLDTNIKTGLFRSDLLFRLRSLTLHLPPLRERKGDIRELAMFQIARICGIEGKETKGVSPDLLQMLEDYDWPGNVRELFQTMEMMLAKAKDEPLLFPTHLPTRIRAKVVRSTVSQSTGNKDAPSRNSPTASLLPTLKEFRQIETAMLEKRYLLQLLTLSNGKIAEACRIADISRGRLYELMKTHNISPRKRAV
ncbi:sigma-54-dependent transcriptional regulator [Thermodesulfobacteriota bacterium]